MHALTIACRCLAWATLSSVALADVIIEAPPQVIPASFRLNSGETLNVRPGGEVGGSMVALAGSVVNVSGGRVEPYFTAATGSEVHISGGRVGSVDTGFLAGFAAAQGSVVTISGGEVGDGLAAAPGSDVAISGGRVGLQVKAAAGSQLELIGNDFRMDGVPYSSGDITMSRVVNSDSIFTGTLADGSPFVFSPLTGGGQFGDDLQGVVLTRVELSPIDLTPSVVDGSTAAAPSGLRAGQAMTLKAGGALPSYFAVVDGTLSIEGGAVGKGLEVAGSIVNLSDGQIGQFFNTYAGSTVNITGGTVGFRFEATDTAIDVSGGHIGTLFGVHNGSTAKISGGKVDGMEVSGGAVVNITGGSIGFGGSLYSSFRAYSGSEARIAGGAFGQSFRSEAGSKVELVGGDFRINGQAVTDSVVTLAAGDVFTGTFADGGSFVFSPLHGDLLENVKLTQSPLLPPDTSPRVVDTPQTHGPAGLRSGQTLTLREGGVLQDNFAVVGATLHVEGGDAGAGVEVVGGSVNILGGNVGAGLSVIDANLNLSGGSIGERSTVNRGAVVNITGGSIGTKFSALEGSRVRFAGGSVGPDFRTYEGSDVEFVGGEFKLNGQDYLGDEITLGARGGELQVFSGVLSDGSPFLFSPNASPLGDVIAGVKLTRTAAPAADLTPQFIDSPRVSGPNGLRPGQTMTVVEGGELQDNFTAIGALLNIEGGRVGSFLEVLDSTVQISGGEVGGWLQAYNSDIDISGGNVGTQFTAFSGTTTTIDAASVRGLTLYANTYTEITGGSDVEFSVQLLGGELKVSESTIGGSLSSNGKLLFSGGTVKQTLSIGYGEAVIKGGYFEGLVSINGSHVQIETGVFEGRLATNQGGVVDISNGTFNRDLWNRLSTINISGGQFSDDILNGSPTFSNQSGTMNISGGDFRGDFANASGTVNISGGTFDGDVSNGAERLSGLSTMNLSGGSFNGAFTALAGSSVNIRAAEFYLDGVLVNLVENRPTKIAARNVRLSGRFADGNWFAFDLFSSPSMGQDFFSANATLTLTLVPIPEPAGAMLAILTVSLSLLSPRKTLTPRE